MFCLESLVLSDLLNQSIWFEIPLRNSTVKPSNWERRAYVLHYFAWTTKSNVINWKTKCFPLNWECLPVQIGGWCRLAKARNLLLFENCSCCSDHTRWQGDSEALHAAWPSASWALWPHGGEVWAYPLGARFNFPLSSEPTLTVFNHGCFSPNITLQPP